MKILLLSDSHGHTEKILSVLERHRDIVYAVHLGDYGTDMDIARKAFPLLLTEAVQGNNDRSSACSPEKILQLEGKRIFLTHGHGYNVGRSLAPLIAQARRMEAEVAAFGHTHVPLVEQRDGILLINPGCLYRPRSLHGLTYALLEITPDGMDAHIYSV